MFKRDTEVMTAFGWKKVQDLKVKDVLWDGDDLYLVKEVKRFSKRDFARLLLDGMTTNVVFTPEQTFVDTEGKARVIGEEFTPDFIQEGEEMIPKLGQQVATTRNTYYKFYKIAIENSSKYYIRVNENTGVLVNC